MARRRRRSRPCRGPGRGEPRRSSTPQPAPAPAPRPVAFEYSDGYYTRLKIHKWASFATLPLFATQVVLGQKLYNGDASDSVRSAHNAVAVGTGVLFGVNTVTGVWNMVEGRKDPNRKTAVKVHGILMLLADAGFAATGFMAPNTEHEERLRVDERRQPVDPPRDRALVDGRRDGRLPDHALQSLTR